MPGWEKILDWLGKFSPRYAVVLWVGSGFLLWSPARWLEPFALASFAETYRAYIALVFVASTLWVLTFPVQQLWLVGSKHLYVHRKRKQLEHYFLHLGTDQVLILLKYVESGKNSIHFYPTEGAVQDLVYKGILYRPAQQLTINGQIAYNITQEAARFLEPETFQELLLKNNARGGPVREQPGEYR